MFINNHKIDFLEFDFVWNLIRLTFNKQLKEFSIQSIQSLIEGGKDGWLVCGGGLVLVLSLS